MTNTNGYCLAFRRAWAHDAFADLLESSIWNYLYQNAFYEDGERNFNGTIFNLKRGQIVVTPRFLAKGFRISESNARRVIQKLIKLKMVEHQTTTKATIITICNYDKYQLPIKTSEDQTDDQTKNKPRPDRANNNKGIKPIKEITNKISIPSWLPIDDWNDFLEMRKEIKSSPTANAKKLLISKLEKLMASGNDPSEVLKQSTMNNYKGIFEVQENAKQLNNKGKQNDKERQCANAIFEGMY